MGKRSRARREAKRLIAARKRPTFAVDLDARRVPDLPWVIFDGERPPEILEAARRSIAAELDVYPEQVEVKTESAPAEVVPDSVLAGKRR